MNRKVTSIIRDETTPEMTPKVTTVRFIVMGRT
jgi:hypothetical protein